MRQDYGKSRRVAEAFYEHSLRAATDSGLPVLEVTDAEQRGTRFGTRLANAVADAFAQGYEQVIAVGSDCPRLHEVDWGDVAERLEEGQPVLGPTPSRDGVYLIGLTRSHFDPECFAALPWQSPGLFASLHQHLSQQSTPDPFLLAARDDVNSHRELVALVRERAVLPQGLRAALCTVLGPVGHRAHVVTPGSDEHVWRHRSRAPPSVW